MLEKHTFHKGLFFESWHKQYNPPAVARPGGYFSQN
jgi:hypothetical protein